MKIDAETRLVGVIGNPISHSLSPVMHNAAFDALALNYIYMAFQVEKDDLEEAVKGIRALGLAGINVTIPHKTCVIPFLDELSPEAEMIGAVNTILNRSGKLIGYNTDGYGFEMALQKQGGICLKDKNVFIIGAGGAAHAIAGQSVLSGASSVTLTNRTFEKAKSLMEFLNRSSCRCNQSAGKIIPWDKDAWRSILPHSDIIVNTTSIGMKGQGNLALDIPWDSIKKDAVFFDAVYTPMETLFLKEAKRLGYKVVSGLYMLIYQGARAFELWTGKRPPIEVMEKAVLTYFARKGEQDAEKTRE
ncbi:MAG: shikimate dehydrogenase [Thermoanaerobacteraceae bacterium]|nr:shikimate dehydrogenase [Thermoanaerobacteraceae bacterium]